MGRNNVIDGLVSQLRQTNGFDGVSTGTALAFDHRVLGMGVDRAAIVLPAMEPSEQQRLVGGKNAMIWTLSVELYIRHNGDIDVARRDAGSYVQNIIDRINNNFTLGGSAFDAMVISTRVEDEGLKVGRAIFFREDLTVRAEEHFSASQTV